MTLTKRQARVMAEFKGHATADTSRYGWGRRKIVTMQELERAGLVERICVHGVIADWRLTPAGKEWRPS